MMKEPSRCLKTTQTSWNWSEQVVIPTSPIETVSVRACWKLVISQEYAIELQTCCKMAKLIALSKIFCPQLQGVHVCICAGGGGFPTPYQANCPGLLVYHSTFFCYCLQVASESTGKALTPSRPSFTWDTNLKSRLPVLLTKLTINQKIPWPPPPAWLVC